MLPITSGIGREVELLGIPTAVRQVVGAEGGEGLTAVRAILGEDDAVSIVVVANRS
jgi:hypothetical protein